MRTTVVLDDDLAARAKHRAVDERLTLSEFINRALRLALQEGVDAPTQAPFVMVTYGSDSPRVHEGVKIIRSVRLSPTATISFR